MKYGERLNFPSTPQVEHMILYIEGAEKKPWRPRSDARSQAQAMTIMRNIVEGRSGGGNILAAYRSLNCTCRESQHPRTGNHRSKGGAELPARVAFNCRRVIITQAGDMCENVLAVWRVYGLDAQKALRLAPLVVGIQAVLPPCQSPV